MSRKRKKQGGKQQPKHQSTTTLSAPKHKKTAFQLAFDKAKSFVRISNDKRREPTPTKPTRTVENKQIHETLPEEKFSLRSGNLETDSYARSLLENEAKRELVSNKNIDQSRQWQTQIAPETTEEISQVIVGFDFGTSMTKVLIRDNSRTTSYPIPLGQLTNNPEKFLLPTTVSLNKSGAFCISTDSHYVNDLKRNLMVKPNGSVNSEIDLTWQHLSVAYISFVLHLARNWFLKEYGDWYLQSKIAWEFNLGVPSSNQQFGNMRENFVEVARASWLASVDHRGVTLESVRLALDCAKDESKLVEARPHYDDRVIHNELINVIPEVLAEVHGYKMSGAAHAENMHLIVDVGATTLDAAMFILNQNDGNPRTSSLEDAVERLGVYELHQFRIRELCKSLEYEKDSIQAKGNETHSTDIVLSPEDYPTSILLKPVDDIDMAFKNNCMAQIRKILAVSKEKCPIQGKWKEGVPVVICGGGAKMDLYKRAVEDARQGMQDVAPFQFRVFELPKDLVNEDGAIESLVRLAVAYGLSYSRIDMGEIIDKSKIKVWDKPNRKDYTDTYIGPEQV